MLGGFDPTGRFGGAGPEPRWQIVREWERQYDVREVNLDAPVGDDVSILVVPQPSRLPAVELRRLHDYIWAGRPALILEDPLPMFSGPQLATSQPKRPNPMMGAAEPPEDSSGEFHQLLTSLGLDVPSDQILWSDYNPSRAFRHILPPGFIWCARDQGGFSDSPVMTGIQSLLLPFPGLIRPATDHGDLTIIPLVTPAVTSSWGTNSFRDYVTFDPFSGGMRQVEPHRYLPENGAPPAVAVQITGKMRRAFPFEPKPAPATTGPTTHPATAPTGVGQLGPSSVHVIYIADVDLAHDQFFEFYRNADNRFSQDELRFLQDLRNVQFLSNAVDALAGDESFLQLRSRRPQRRPLERLDSVLAGTQKELRDVESAAQKDADAKIARLRDDIQQRLDRIRDRKDLDAQARDQLVAQVQRSANRQLEKDIQEVNHEADLKTRKARIEQQRRFERVLNYGVRAKALGFPAVVLAALALTVFAVRLRGERLDIPESRRRHRP
jgi:ABC-2 type transport system permease protein